MPIIADLHEEYIHTKTGIFYFYQEQTKQNMSFEKSEQNLADCAMFLVGLNARRGRYRAPAQCDGGRVTFSDGLLT